MSKYFLNTTLKSSFILNLFFLAVFGVTTSSDGERVSVATKPYLLKRLEAPSGRLMKELFSEAGAVVRYSTKASHDYAWANFVGVWAVDIRSKQHWYQAFNWIVQEEIGNVGDDGLEDLGTYRQQKKKTQAYAYELADHALKIPFGWYDFGEPTEKGRQRSLRQRLASAIYPLLGLESIAVYTGLAGVDTLHSQHVAIQDLENGEVVILSLGIRYD